MLVKTDANSGVGVTFRYQHENLFHQFIWMNENALLDNAHRECIRLQVQLPFTFHQIHIQKIHIQFIHIQLVHIRTQNA